jgi:hypothetical protein
MFFGWLLALASGIEVVQAIMVGHWAGFFHHLVAVLFGVTGFLLVTRPVLSAEVATMLMAVFFLVSGLFQFIGSIWVALPGWGWQTVDGIIAIVLGLLVPCAVGVRPVMLGRIRFLDKARWPPGLLLGDRPTALDSRGRPTPSWPRRKSAASRPKNNSSATLKAARSRANRRHVRTGLCAGRDWRHFRRRPSVTLGMTALRSTGATLYVPWLLSNLARAYVDLLDDAWRCIDEAMTAMQTTKERWCEAEVNRIAGEIALKSSKPDTAKAQKYFERALTVARQQQAKSWELRAAMSMARLWRDQGKPQQARELLAPVYGWFTEGFDTRDLKEAKALLEELSA